MTIATETETLGTVNVPFALTRQLADYILIGAFEGGINYWCLDADLTASTARPQDIYYAVPGFVWELTVLGGPVGTGAVRRLAKTTVRLTEAGLVEGLQKYVEWQSTKPGATDLPDFDNLDAGDYDCIVQFAVFGELVYG